MLTRTALGPRQALTPKEHRFVAEYLLDLNATQAALRAGYSRRRASRTGWELLRKSRVAEAVASAQAELAGKVGVTVERIVTELARIGFSDIRDVLQWRSVPVDNDPDQGATNAGVLNLVKVKSADELTPAAAAAIAELSLQPPGGVRVRLHDKRAALIALGKHLGMFGKRHEDAGGVTVQIVRFGKNEEARTSD